MTIKRLEQYASKRKELAYLRRRVADLRERAATQRVSDTVKASSRSFPYTEYTVTVRGYSDKCAAHLANAIRRLAQREAYLAQELDEIEKWLDTVQDSKTRLLIEWYYVACSGTKGIWVPVRGRCTDASKAVLRRKFIACSFCSVLLMYNVIMAR